MSCERATSSPSRRCVPMIDVDAAGGEIREELLLALLAGSEPGQQSRPAARGVRSARRTCWRCCSASTVVGTRTPTCRPVIATRNAARIASSVLPNPTSPQSRRSIGCSLFEVSRGAPAQHVTSDPPCRRTGTSRGMARSRARRSPGTADDGSVSRLRLQVEQIGRQVEQRRLRPPACACANPLPAELVELRARVTRRHRRTSARGGSSKPARAGGRRRLNTSRRWSSTDSPRSTRSMPSNNAMPCTACTTRSPGPEFEEALQCAARDLAFL